jgi:glycerol-3-phosphate dehydrogenase (NAD(P)+)
MARVAVFGAGAAGTAVAIHLARKGEDVVVWGSEYDVRVLPDLMDRRVHPALPERLPDGVQVLGPGDLSEAASGSEIAVMGANSSGARSLGEMVGPALGAETRFLVSVAKGLEDKTLLRVSEVYAETCRRPVVVLSGPSLAPEVAEGLLTGVAMASTDSRALARATEVFRSPSFLVDPTDDVAGVELCGTAKNVAAIGAGIIEGLAKYRQRDLKNARAALFTRAVHEIADLVEAAGGRRETALGLAGMGDLLVTMLGGRNRIYGEALGLGSEPQHTLRDMQARGLTVEGAGSSQEVQALMERLRLDLPIHRAVFQIVHEGAPPERILEAVM